jgi:hypothetical protein
MIPSDNATAEIRLERVEKLNVAFVLHDGELRKYLKAYSHVGMR